MAWDKDKSGGKHKNDEDNDFLPFFDYRNINLPGADEKYEGTKEATDSDAVFFAGEDDDNDDGEDVVTDMKTYGKPTAEQETVRFDRLASFDRFDDFNSPDAEATAIMPKIPRPPIQPREEYGEDYGGAGDALFVDDTPTIGMDVIKSDDTEQKPGFNLPDPEQFFRTEAEEKPMLVAQGGGASAQVIARRERIRDLKRDAAVRTAGQLFGAVLLVLVITALSVFLAYYIVRGALDFVGIDTNDYQTQVNIPHAATTEDIAEILHNNGIIDMPELFVLYSRLTGKDGEYLDGTFTVRSTMHYGGIADVLMSPKYYEQIVTLQITEGMTSDDIGALLEENQICTAEDFREFYQSKMNIYNFEKRVDVSAEKFYQMEGYLFPDTYEFYVCDVMDDDMSSFTGEQLKEARDEMKAAAKTAAQKMYSAFNNNITKEMYRKMYDMGMTLNDVVTLASMVQREAASEEDMALVASVFLNRLRDSEVFPRLQSDVTVIYANDYIGSSHQLIQDAYNTYASDGLPPGPICNPGLDAITAVLDAPSTSYYYFCADEQTLQIYYATTIAEHEANLAMIGLTAGDAAEEHGNG